MRPNCATSWAVMGPSLKCPSLSLTLTSVRTHARKPRMPELPDITVYVEALRQRILGAKLESTRITHPFLLRTFEPPLTALQGRRVVDLLRVGKRVAVGFEGDQWLVLHLMIAGRVDWFVSGGGRDGRTALA